MERGEGIAPAASVAPRAPIGPEALTHPPPAPSAPPGPPASPAPHPEDATAGTRRPLVLAAMMLAMFMAAVEATIVATALPTIVADLGGFQYFSWVFAAYLLTTAVTIPVYGKLADMYGRKRVFYAGAVLFLTGSTLCGFSGTMGQLIAFRALQGLGAGAVQTLALTVIGDIYPGAERAKVQGYISSVWGFSSVIGPALGAFFVEKLHWSLVFWVNIPIGIVSMTMLALFLHERVEHHDHRIDYTGSLLMMAGTGILMLALIQASQLPLPGIVGLVGVAAVLGYAFLRTERSAPEPMMPLALWRYRIIALGNTGGLTAGALMMGVTTFLPTYVQGVMGRSPAVAGFTLAAMSIGWPLASTTAGRLMVRTSYRFTAILGGLGLLSGSAVLIAMHASRGPLWAAAGAFLIGTGMGFSNTSYLVSIQTSVDWKQRGVATSSNLFMRIVGSALGVAGLGAVLNLGLHARVPGAADVVNQLMEQGARQTLGPERIATLGHAMGASLHNVYLIAGALGFVVLLIALQFPRGLNPTNHEAQMAGGEA